VPIYFGRWQQETAVTTFCVDSCRCLKSLKSLLFLLDGQNIDIDSDDGVWTASMIPKGVYRGVPCFTAYEIGETISETRFCPPSTIEQEMTWFLERVQEIQDKDDMDPFRACAWIQWAFVRIHPFADGSGRVARLLSSAPLVRCGLPPVYVSASSKQKYLKALTDADTKDDIDDLVARFLQSEVFGALEQLLRYNQDNMVTIDAVATSATTSPVNSSID
jgi:Fic family protein